MATVSSSGRVCSIIGMTAVVFLVDWFYMTYIIAHGFESRIEAFNVSSLHVALPIQWFPVVGMALPALVASVEISTHIFPKRGFNVDPIGGVRFLRAIVVSLALFVCVLYLPYLIGSNWFWTRLSELSRSFSQIQGFSQSLLITDESAMTLDVLYQYAASQLAAAFALVACTFAFTRVTRRIKKR